jgi:hypothetical protein
MELRVRVNEELTLHCGVAERDSRGATGWTLVPPQISQFDQLIAYLERKPDAARGKRTVSDVETLAATALCLRWGTWFAVLADATKPSWPFAGEPGVAHLSDEELARIRVEATDAFERWIEIYRSDRACSRAIQLAIRAVAWLPGHAPVGVPRSDTFAIGDEGIAAALEAELGDDERAAVAHAPSRALARRLAAEGCDREPVANLTDGCVFPLPLDACRLAPSQATALLSRVNTRMKAAMWTCSWLASESRHRRPWAERVLPFAEPGLSVAALHERAPVVRLDG